MVALTHTTDYVYMLLITGGLGAIGGLAAELLLKRSDNTGTLQLPSRLKGTDLIELGFPASLIIGAIAAVAILYFFPPITETVEPVVNGATTTARSYDLVKLVALSLIVGSGGPAFLSTAQSRLASALNAQKVGTAVETGKNQINQVAASAKAAVAGAVQQAVSTHIPGAGPEQLKAIPDAATASLVSALEPQVEVARQQVDVVGQQPHSDAEAVPAANQPPDNQQTQE